MRAAVLTLVVAGAALLSACEFEGGDPVQHALRDAAAARQAAACSGKAAWQIIAAAPPALASQATSSGVWR